MIHQMIVAMTILVVTICAFGAWGNAYTAVYNKGTKYKYGSCDFKDFLGLGALLFLGLAGTASTFFILPLIVYKAIFL